MHRRRHAVRRSVTPVLATIAAAGTLLFGGRADAAVTPPPNTPDLAAMALQVGDLPPGTVVENEGYQEPLPGTLALYDRTMTLQGAAGPLVVNSAVALDESALTATTQLRLERNSFRTRRGRRIFGHVIADAIGMGKARVQVEPPQRYDAGDGAFTVRVRIAVSGVVLRAVYGNVRVDRAIGVISVIGTGARTTLRRTRDYLRVAADHMRAVLTPVPPPPPAP